MARCRLRSRHRSHLERAGIDDHARQRVVVCVRAHEGSEQSESREAGHQQREQCGRHGHAFAPTERRETASRVPHPEHVEAHRDDRDWELGDVVVAHRLGHSLGNPDLHLHPLEPRAFRFTVSKTF